MAAAAAEWWTLIDRSEQAATACSAAAVTAAAVQEERNGEEQRTTKMSSVLQRPRDPKTKTASLEGVSKIAQSSQKSNERELKPVLAAAGVQRLHPLDFVEARSAREHRVTRHSYRLLRWLQRLAFGDCDGRIERNRNRFDAAVVVAAAFVAAAVVIVVAEIAALIVGIVAVADIDRSWSGS